MTAARVLILGGTAEARELAEALIRRPGVEVVSSLAGRVNRPRLPAGDVRVGGFGGPEAMSRWLRDTGVVAVVDATHPFAERISASAAAACGVVGVPRLVLRRPGWSDGPGDRWEWVDSLTDAAARIPRLGRRAFLTTGRQGLEAFADVDRVWFLVRCVDPPQVPLPREHRLLLDRGPYDVASESALMGAHGIDVLVTKDSGAPQVAAKLEAARAREVPVIMVRRPRPPGGPSVETVGEALAWVEAVVSRGGCAA